MSTTSITSTATCSTCGGSDHRRRTSRLCPNYTPIANRQNNQDTATTTPDTPTAPCAACGGSDHRRRTSRRCPNYTPPANGQNNQGTATGNVTNNIEPVVTEGK